MPYYAVFKGRRPGIYESWDHVKSQVFAFRGAVYKKFEERTAAEVFMATGKDPDSKDEDLHCIDFSIPSDNMLVCFTDGSAFNNGNKLSKCGFAVVWPHHPQKDYSQHLHSGSTNNRAEFSAVIHALCQADEIDPSKTKTLIVFTDSMLLINSMTKWVQQWEKKGYKKADGTDVLNADLIRVLRDKMKRRDVTFKHVKAHTGGDSWQAVYNDRVDKLARAAADISPIVSIQSFFKKRDSFDD